jgi:hypothetical protein
MHLLFVQSHVSCFPFPVQLLSSHDSRVPWQMSAPKSSPAPVAAAPAKVAETKVQSAAFVALKSKNKSLKAELAKLEVGV